jgi:hypothetical protein
VPQVAGSAVSSGDAASRSTASIIHRDGVAFSKLADLKKVIVCSTFQPASGCLVSQYMTA